MLKRFMVGFKSMIWDTFRFLQQPIDEREGAGQNHTGAGGVNLLASVSVDELRMIIIATECVERVGMYGLIIRIGIRPLGRVKESQMT